MFLVLFNFSRISITRLYSSKSRNTVRMLSVIFSFVSSILILMLDFSFVSFLLKFSVLVTVVYYFLSVLPKFSVKLTVPPFILKTDKWITINITTRYE